MARNSLTELFAAIETSIPQPLLAESRQHLGAETTSAQSWSEFAAAVLLMGDVELAAWAGLQAVKLDWDGELVGNAGTYLLHAGREEARTWLLCARDMGPRSPFVLEALATSYESAGDVDQAREAITAAKRLAPDDPMIEVSHALLTTGEPPSPAPRPDAATERCLADLELHAQSVFSRVEAQQKLLDELTRLDSREQAFAGVWEYFYESQLTQVRGLIDMTPTMQGSKGMWHNQVLVQCITTYFAFTEQLLRSVVRDNGTTLTFWAAAMNMEAVTFVRDTTEDDEPVFSLSRLPSTAADRAYRDADEEASNQYRRDRDVCNAIRDAAASGACDREAERRECVTNTLDFEEWEALQRGNYDTAALTFDRVALELLRWVEREVEDAHYFAARYAMELKNDGPALPGPGGRSMRPGEMALDQINNNYRKQILVEPYLTTGTQGVDDFITEQAEWFDREKEHFEREVESRRQSLSERCDPILLREELEALAQEEWEAYRQELWDRMMANIEAEWDPTLSCEFEAGGFKMSIDDSGSGGLSTKWKQFDASLDSSGKLNLSGKWKFNNASLNARTTIQNGQVVSTSVGVNGSAQAAPGVVAKGGVSMVSDGSRGESALVFSGSLELGIQRGGVGASCSPGSGSVKVYPRAFGKAAVNLARQGGY